MTHCVMQGVLNDTLCHSRTQQKTLNKTPHTQTPKTTQPQNDSTHTHLHTADSCMTHCVMQELLLETLCHLAKGFIDKPCMTQCVMQGVLGSVWVTVWVVCGFLFLAVWFSVFDRVVLFGRVVFCF